MKTKGNKIFSLTVLVTVITVFALVSTASAEPPEVPTILNTRYGIENWEGPLSQTEISFTQTSEVVVVYVDAHVAGNPDPTGWYATGSGTKHEIWAAPSATDTQDINPGEPFGMYIESEGTTFYSEASKNTNAEAHAQLYKVTAGDHRGKYVVAFEDLLFTNPNCDHDYNDVVLELKNVNPIPEFATIAIPTVAILGMFLFLNHRKQKKE
jgi:hypothetical protein